MAEKEFERKYMHPTRRKLAEMVHTGEYEREPSSGWTPETEDDGREIGETWTDDKYIYTKRKNGKVSKERKSAKIFREAREWLAKREQCKNPDCKSFKKTQKDKRLITKTGYCINCLADLETEIRHHGIFEDYVKYRTYTNMIKDGLGKIENLTEQIANAKQVYEYVNSDGTTDTWELPQPVEDYKKELQTIIDNGKKEIEELEKRKEESWDVIKNSNFDENKINVW